MISILAHKLTEAQIAELGGEPIHVRDLDPALAAQIANCPADGAVLAEMAGRLCHLVNEHGGKVLAGSGSPAFTASLGRVAAQRNIILYFAHSERVSIDEPQPDGSVKKTAVFKHVRFFEV